MDDQNNLDNQSTTAVDPITPPVQDLPVSGEPKKEKVTSFAQIDSSTPPSPPIPTVEEISGVKEEQSGKEKTNKGSSTPIVDIPPIVTPPEKPKKKFGGKTIATILGILVLIGGISAGIILVQQGQDIREKARMPEESELYDGGPDRGMEGGKETYVPPLPASSEPGTDIEKEVGGINCEDYEDPDLGYAPDYPTEAVAKACCPDKYYTKYDKWYCGTPPNPPPNPTAKPTAKPTARPIICQCLDIKAYDTSWNLLTIDDLSNLQEGDKVRFAVKGIAESGIFDKAKFKINSILQPVTTAKRPGSEKFYIEYTIPAGVTTFTIDAKIHHPIEGWI